MPNPTREILLTTPRLYLRRFQADDAPLLYALDSDPEVMRFITKGQATPMTQIENEILPRLLGHYAYSPPRGCFAAHLRGDDEFIGWFHLRPDKLTPAEMELGYRLKRSAWGQGLATEGSRARVENAFGLWDYPKVCARTLIGNLASQRVMEKAGLRFEAEFIYPLSIIPDWTQAERRAVKFSLSKAEFACRAPQ